MVVVGRGMPTPLRAPLRSKYGAKRLGDLDDLDCSASGDREKAECRSNLYHRSSWNQIKRQIHRRAIDFGPVADRRRVNRRCGSRILNLDPFSSPSIILDGAADASSWIPALHRVVRPVPSAREIKLPGISPSARATNASSARSR